MQYHTYFLIKTACYHQYDFSIINITENLVLANMTEYNDAYVNIVMYNTVKSNAILNQHLTNCFRFQRTQSTNSGQLQLINE